MLSASPAPVTTLSAMTLPRSSSEPGDSPSESLLSTTDANHVKSAKKKKKKKRQRGSNSFSQFNEFPRRIQRHVFECAYYLGFVDGPVLALVSRTVNEWIEPLMYSYIIVDRFNRISHRPDRLWNTLSNSTKTHEFFKRHVKGILISGSVDPVLTDLLAICTDISSFACYAQGALTETILEKLASIFSTLEFPQLRRLSLSGLGLDKSDIQRQFFQNLTHLAVDVGDNYEAFPWLSLKSHRCLTHILVDVQLELHKEAPEQFKAMVLDILSNAPLTLHCLVILIDWDILYESSLQQKCDRTLFSEIIDGRADPRVVVAGYTGNKEEIDVTVVGEHPVQFLQYVGYVALVPEHTVPWVCPPNGSQKDVWERAEDVLRQRQAHAE